MPTAVAIEQIVFDAGTQVRAAINEEVVTQYAERMAAGDAFPAVVLFHDGNRYYLGDGFHRSLAAQRNGLAEIPADVRPGTQQDALWFALGANKANGQRLSEDDKRHAIELALSVWPDKPASEIAEQVGCGHSYVSRVRAEVSTGGNLPEYVTGKDGKQYPASRGPNAKSTEKRERIAALVREGVPAADIAAEVGASMTTVTEVRKELGVPTLDKSRAAVAQRREDIRSMAARGYTTRQIAAAVGIGESAVYEIAKTEGIVIHADRAVGVTRRHDANRIVEQMVMDAENITADVALIEFHELDASKLSGWIDSLTKSRQSLNAFIRRLSEEQKKHGEAA